MAERTCEIAERTCEIAERTAARRVALIRVAVLRAAGGERDVSGVVACPACEDGDVFYSVTGDGRITSACSNPYCASYSR